MFVAGRNILITRSSLVKKICRTLSSIQHKQKTTTPDANKKSRISSDGPSLREFLKSNASSKSESIGQANDDDDDAQIENRIFLANVKRLNQQVTDIDDVAVEQQRATSRKKAVYFEIHGCQMNVNDTEVAYTILSQTGFLLVLN